MPLEELKEKIHVYEDFPIEGISFKDINSVLIDPDAFTEVIDTYFKFAKALDINKICAPESRGYFFASPLAYLLKVALVPVRKPGKLPGIVETESYSLEYGENIVQIQEHAVEPGDRVLIIDDLLATGGTMKATCNLVERLGGEVAGALFLIELEELKGRELLKEYTIKSLVRYDR
ncbi:MAG: adenine phosphoribosyltransferase [Eubacteriaceae bacterium]|jgi:adenine phosphoribosyltransferase|nr:adenine phosphoribosyltransferase [Eubacteriaceae bacterium]